MTLDSLVSKKLNININIQLLYILLNFIICLKYWILKRCILFFSQTCFLFSLSQYRVPPPRREGLRENQDINKENDQQTNSINEAHVETLIAMGYNRLHVVNALRVSRNNIKMAEEILKTFVKQWSGWPLASSCVCQM